MNKTKLILLIISFKILNLGQIFAQQDECVPTESTKLPLFWVSSATDQGNKVFENLRSLHSTKNKIAYLPNESIVRLIQNEDNDNTYKHIEVITSPHILREKNMVENFTNIKGRAVNRAIVNFFKKLIPEKSLKRAEPGLEANIYHKSLVSMQYYSFVLKNAGDFSDSFNQKEDELIVVEPVMKAGTNEYLKDCENSDNYIFKVYKKKPTGDQVVGDIKVSLNDDVGRNFISNLIAIPAYSADTILRILQYVRMDTEFTEFSHDDIEYLHTLTLFKFPIDQETLESPYSSTYYNPDTHGKGDIFAKTMTMCAFMAVLKKYKETVYDGENGVQVGDMFHRDDWHDHKSHDEGTCIDIRPLRNDGKLGNLTVNSRSYSRTLTKKFINILIEAGGSKIFFNDSILINTIPNLKRLRGHDNHVHVCFEPTSKLVQNACFKGIN